MTFSVIVPLYNVEKYARESIESVLHQTYGDFELILVDDGSTDNTGAVIDEYGIQDSRVKIIHKKNGGVTSARKAGVTLATGEYVVFLDSDDWLMEDYLQKFSEAIFESKSDILICSFNQFAENGTLIPLKHQLDTGLWDRRHIENQIATGLLKIPGALWAKAFRRTQINDLIQEIDDSIVIGEDGCVTYSMITVANSIYILDYHGYNYRYVGNSATHRRRLNVSWDNVIWRVDFLDNHFQQYGTLLQDQMRLYVMHACTTIIKSELTYKSTCEVFQQAKAKLQTNTICKHFVGRILCGSFTEKLVYYLLKYKILLPFRILAVLK